MDFSIYRLSTPTHKFLLPFSKDYVEDIRLTYKQLNNIVVEKSGKEINYSGDKEFYVVLSQEETRAFSDNDIVKIQAVVLTKNGKLIPSTIIKKTVQEVLNDEVFDS